MNFKNIEWNQNTYQEYLKYLESLADIKYLEFNKKLVTTKYKMIGIRLPILRKIAKQISKTDIDTFIRCNRNIYFEEVFIQGFVIASFKDNMLLKKYLNKYVNLIDNWAINDSLANSLKIINNNKEVFFQYFVDFINTNKEYHIRLALVVFLNFYITEEYIDRVFEIIKNIKSEKYYVNMALAWCLAEIYVTYPKEVEEILNLKYLSPFVINKTIDKIRDSYRVDKIKKESLKKLKVSKTTKIDKIYGD